MEESVADILARLQPVLNEIFFAYGISEDDARRIVDETTSLLLSKRWDRRYPSRWLLRAVIERCREVAMRLGEDAGGGLPH